MFRAILALLAVAGALWSLAVWIVGGFMFDLAGLTIESRDPFRPLALGGVAAITYIAIAGPAQIRRNIRQSARRFAAPLAIVLALCPALAGLARNSWTAGGADSYAYVSQADLWLQRNLVVAVPLADSVPWPDAVWTFAPHGFRPAVSGTALVPVTAPGLPLLMAAAKTIGGHCAMFVVTPLSGALLVWLTFAIGRGLGSDVLGLAAAWLVATSPAVLAMLVSPMSDVPAAALWAAAIYFALGHTARSGLMSGFSASAAILIRPNLAPLALVLVMWKSWTGSGAIPAASAVATGLRGVLPMTAGILPGCLLVAWLNNALYGSPLASGYGTLPGLFSLSNIATNLRRYGGWLIESQTPLAVVGIAVLFVPLRIIWRTREQQRAACLLAAIVATVWALYLVYTPYDAWWFLRFLLPCWPAMCVGIAAAPVRVIQTASALPRAAALAVLIAIGIYGINFAVRNGAFPTGEGDHRYASVARLVEQSTDPSSVIFAGQHSGPTRYYAGRPIVRFDLLDRVWLDRAVQWLTDHGRRPYVLLEEWEIPAFQERFAPASTLGALGLAPVLAYQAPGVPGSVFLFDPARPDGNTLRPTPPASARATCVEPSLMNARN
jgi:hypothetical protein